MNDVECIRTNKSERNNALMHIITTYNYGLIYYIRNIKEIIIFFWIIVLIFLKFLNLDLKNMHYSTEHFFNLLTRNNFYLILCDIIITEKTEDIRFIVYSYVLSSF